MKIEKELKLYKKALRDYRLSKVFGKCWFDTYAGFCAYFRYKYDDIWDIDNLTILRSLRPASSLGCMYWFKCGELQPRIELLKKAILICKNKINNIN